MNDLFRQGAHLSHAYLFTGKAAPAASRNAARTLLCTSGEGCGTCHTCQMFDEGTHPDYIPLADEKSIRIDPLREALRNVASSSRMGGRRVVHITEAGKLTVQAQNALLKTLENPPEGVVFLLCGETGLLPTILSRCVRVRCDADLQALRGQLMHGGASDDLAALLSAIGEPPIDPEALLSEEARSLRHGAHKAALKLYEQPERTASYYASQENLPLVLALQASFFADAASLANGGPIRNEDARPLLERCADPVLCLHLFELCADSARRLGRNAAAHLTASRLSILAKRAQKMI